MADFTAADVKKLRELTGAGMMDCKKALEETTATSMAPSTTCVPRVPPSRKAQRRAHRQRGSRGGVRQRRDRAELREDFVAKTSSSRRSPTRSFAAADAAGIGDREALLSALCRAAKTVREAIDGASAVIGEKLDLVRWRASNGQVEIYLHRKSKDLPASACWSPTTVPMVRRPPARSTADRVMKPLYVTRDQVPADIVEHERKIAEATAREEGKPEAALTKITEGRVQGFYKDVVLLEQNSVQDSRSP